MPQNWCCPFFPFYFLLCWVVFEDTTHLFTQCMLVAIRIEYCLQYCVNSKWCSIQIPCYFLGLKRLVFENKGPFDLYWCSTVGGSSTLRWILLGPLAASACRDSKTFNLDYRKSDVTAIILGFECISVQNQRSCVHIPPMFCSPDHPSIYVE